MKIAVMQPYLFPYIGYFQLLQAVDLFVFYDDVQYIKRGWINRNRILLHQSDHVFTLACNKASPNKLINELTFNPDNPANKKILKTITQAYKKAPQFEAVYPILQSVFDLPTASLAVLAQESIRRVAEYLELQVRFKVSSEVYGASAGMDKADRLIAICKTEKANEYINGIGGKELYNKAYFKRQDIKLNFLQPKADIAYKQGNAAFIPQLSIIDVLMYNDIEACTRLLGEYELV